jgi:hypothetical protein
MNREIAKSLIALLHDDAHKAQHMCYVVFHDGEVCLTKGADLFLQRSLHMQVAGTDGAPVVLPEDMPHKLGPNGYCVVLGRIEAIALSAALGAPRAQWDLEYASKGEASQLLTLLH